MTSSKNTKIGKIFLGKNRKMCFTILHPINAKLHHCDDSEDISSKFILKKYIQLHTMYTWFQPFISSNIWFREVRHLQTIRSSLWVSSVFLFTKLLNILETAWNDVPNRSNMTIRIQNIGDDTPTTGMLLWVFFFFFFFFFFVASFYGNRDYCCRVICILPYRFVTFVL